MRRVVFMVCGLLTACGSGLREGVFIKDDVRYHVAVLDEAVWHRVAVSDNDLAWASKDPGHLLAMNATCRDHGDPALDTLTTHLLFGFTDKELKDRRMEQLDGRESLRSKYVAKLDGVPSEIEVVVMKKNGCVHDFTYVAPLGQAGKHQAEFDSLVAGFRQEPRQ